MKKVLFLLLFILIVSSVFSQEKTSSLLPVILNILPGFGVGSFVQGDTETGIIALCGDAFAAAFIVGGILSLNYKDSNNYIEPIMCLSFGGLLYIVMKTYSIIKPIRFTNAPSISFIGNGFVISLSF